MDARLRTSRIKSLQQLEDEEVVDTAKAIHDVVMEKVPEEINQRLKDVEHDTALLVGSLVEKMLTEKFKEWEDRFTEMKGLVKTLGDMVGSSKSRMEGLEVSYLGGMNQVKALLQNMPIPQLTVNIPKDAIQINQLPSVVNIAKDSINVQVDRPIVNVPEGSIQVNVQQTPSIVNVPRDAINVHVQQPTSVVNIPKDAINVRVPASVVNIPESAIQVKVDHKAFMKPRVTKSRKKINYDRTTGRPESIDEEVIETLE